MRIGGSLKNKTDAACKILEYIEVFKSGGSVGELLYKVHIS